MAVLYAVTGADRGFPLVMKVPRLGHGERGEAVVTYDVEATVLAALKGSHVPRFVAAGELAVRPYIVMERIEGRSLQDWVGEAPLPFEEVARLGGAVAAAAHAIHLQDAIHLDLKPSNVVCDAGLANLIDLSIARAPGRARTPVGTRPYMAPEQARGGHLSEAADVWGLGAVLYEAATARRPFKGSDHDGYPQTNGRPESARRWRRLPAAVVTAIDASLEPDTSARPTLAQLAGALEPFAEPAGSG
jgi:serine/threonine protein kinase